MRAVKKLLLPVPLQGASFEMGLLCCHGNDVIECITLPGEFCIVSAVRATRTSLLGHICYDSWSKHSKALFPRMLPHHVLMQVQQNNGNPGGITAEMRRDSMTVGRFQRLGLECSVMHQFLGHESAVCEVPSPTQPFTPTVCDVDETVWQKCAALLCDEE
jgi:hypothetical protein